MIPIVWTSYTATASGRVLKLVPCEHCSTEYVYVLEREVMGCGTSYYLLNEDGAEQEAREGAAQMLQSSLENDFDPVPCPVCGHYQRYMFPKLYEPAAWIQAAQLAVLVAAAVCAVIALYCSFTYLQRPVDTALWQMVAAWAVLAVLGLSAAGLRALERARARRFDPNTEDQQARIAKGKSRAITRAEFEAAQQQDREARDQFIERLKQKGQRDTAKSEQENPPTDSA